MQMFWSIICVLSTELNRLLIYIAKGIKALLCGNLSNYISALSEADAGIAINTGAAIAKEIADITVSSEDFFSLLS